MKDGATYLAQVEVAPPAESSGRSAWLVTLGSLGLISYGLYYIKDMRTKAEKQEEDLYTEFL